MSTTRLFTRLNAERNQRILARPTVSMVQAFKHFIEVEGLQESVFIMSAPYEADAQLSSLEQQGITDGSLSTDGDIYFLGGRTVHSGFSTRSTQKYKSIIDGSCRHAQYEGLTPGQRAVLAGFHGTDYIGKLYRWSPARAFKEMQKWLKLSQTERDTRLDELEKTSKWR